MTAKNLIHHNKENKGQRKQTILVIMYLQICWLFTVTALLFDLLIMDLIYIGNVFDIYLLKLLALITRNCIVSNQVNSWLDKY